jgi:sugar phosphate isomerase/epimerase
MAAVADKLAGSKFTLLFHNHDHELIEQCEGRDALDAIFDTIPAEKLKVQIDTYFVKHVGRDPGAYIRRYAGRLPLLHLKEKPAQPSPYVNTEIGRGIIDWSDVFAAAEAADVAWFVIEQKCEQFDPLTSAKMSIDYLKSCGVARPR